MLLAFKFLLIVAIEAGPQSCSARAWWKKSREAMPFVAPLDRRQGALEKCLEKLEPRDRELIESRYAEGGSVQAIAARAGKTVNAISKLLYRIRGNLLKCMERSLATVEANEY